VERATELSAKMKTSVFVALQDPAFRAETTKRAAESIDAFVSFLDQWETKMHEPLVRQAPILREFIKRAATWTI
jgi:hypothetical protein